MMEEARKARARAKRWKWKPLVGNLSTHNCENSAGPGSPTKLKFPGLDSDGYEVMPDDDDANFSLIFLTKDVPDLGLVCQP